MSLELLTLSGFEGPEKVIEINLVPNIGPENNQGLRNLTEAEWTTILSAAHCNILCKKSNEYILSICCCWCSKDTSMLISYQNQACSCILTSASSRPAVQSPYCLCCLFYDVLFEYVFLDLRHSLRSWSWSLTGLPTVERTSFIPKNRFILIWVWTKKYFPSISSFYS